MKRAIFFTIAQFLIATNAFAIDAQIDCSKEGGFVVNFDKAKGWSILSNGKEINGSVRISGVTLAVTIPAADRGDFTAPNEKIFTFQDVTAPSPLSGSVEWNGHEGKVRVGTVSCDVHAK